MIFSDTGNIVLETFATAIPAVYCARSGKRGVFSGFGFICLYGGLLATSVMFLFIPESLHKAILGAALLISLCAAGLLMTLSNAYERYLYEQRLIKKPEMLDYKTQFSLTPKECEVMDYLMDGVLTSEIAGKMFISERTVNFHVGSILRKTSCRNRVEMMAKLKG